MRRPARGGSTHPAMRRPGMGFGRPLRARPELVSPCDVAGELEGFLHGETEGGADVIDLRLDLPSVTRTDSRS